MSSQPKDREYILLGLQIAGDFGAALAVPVVLLVILGQWLDSRFTTGAKFTAGGFVLAALISANIIYRKAVVYGKRYQILNEKGKIINAGNEKEVEMKK